MRIGRLVSILAACAALIPLTPALAAPAARAHNVVIFVADGLRYGVVTPETAPALAAVQRQGVDFRNSHSLFPTITTGNASVIATGHRQGDTGDFGNNDFLGVPAIPSASGDLVPFFEDDSTLADANARFGGNYLNEASLLAAARAAGFSTAAIGKLGPTAIQDVTARDGLKTIVIDDWTGTRNGIPVNPEVVAAIAAAGLPTTAPGRNANGFQGDMKTPGTLTPNTIQLDWMAAVATDVVLPRFKAADKPFVLVFWSRDPDGTQHNQGDSLNSLTPGINGPTVMAAIRNASEHLQRLRDALKRLGLDKTTDIFITADHGFSTVSKQPYGSAAAKLSYPDVPPGFLPPGFLGIDLSLALKLPLYEANGKPLDPRKGEHSLRGSTLLGADPANPDIVIGAQGGSDLIWFPKAEAKNNGEAKALAARVTAFLAAQDYTGALFVDDHLGPQPGALPLSAVALDGTALPARPGIMVSFRSFSTGCARPETCGVDVADSNYQQGQGNHGAFGRADTRNFMAAVGPDFKAGFVDRAPVSNADIVPTFARILGLPFNGKSHPGRVAGEALVGGKPVRVTPIRSVSTTAPGGFHTVLKGSKVGETPYFDTAGAPGRVLEIGKD